MEKFDIGKKLPDVLLDLIVLDKNNQSIKLRKLINTENPTLIIFLRHFGCIGCSVQMSVLAPRISELEALGLKIVIVGNGKPNHINGFIKSYKLENSHVEIVTDPSLRIYKAFHLKRSIMSTFGIRAIYGVIHAVLTGHGQKSLQGDAFQQGGAILLDRNQKILFYHQNNNLIDNAKMPDIIDYLFKTVIKKTPLYKFDK